MAAEDYAGMGLSDEEIAAIDEPEDETTPPVDEDVSDELDDDGEGEQEAAGEAPAPPAAAEPASAKDPAPTPPDPAPAQIYIPPVPEGAAERLAAIDAELDALADKFDDGSEDPGTIQRKINALNKEARGLEADIKAVEIAQQTAEHQARARAEQAWREENQSWGAAKDRFRAANPDYWTNQDKFKELDAAVIFLSNTDPQLAVQHDRLLETAKRFVELKDAAKSPPAHQTSTHRASAPDIPPTLGGLPAAGANSTSKNDFAHLEALTGLELEMALDRMSDAEQAAYLGG